MILIASTKNTSIKNYRIIDLLEVRQTVSVLVSKRNRLEYTLKKFDEFIECQKRIEYLKNDNKLLKEDLSSMSV